MAYFQRIVSLILEMICEEFKIWVVTYEKPKRKGRKKVSEDSRVGAANINLSWPKRIAEENQCI